MQLHCTHSQCMTFLKYTNMPTKNSLNGCFCERDFRSSLDISVIQSRIWYFPFKRQRVSAIQLHKYLKISLSPMYTGTLAKYTENYALILHLIKLNPVYMYSMPYTVIEAKESP